MALKDCERLLPPLHPNAGIEVEYKRRLRKLIEQMHDSVVYWVSAAWRGEPPVMAQDALPASVLQKIMRKLRTRWQKRFNDLSWDLATHFSTAVNERSDVALQAALKKSGIAIKFTMTRAQRDVLKSTVNRNVSLIKSIPQQHMAQVEQLVMQSVQTGRDLGTLSKALQDQFGVTKRRAALIARDQNNKATASLNRARQTELGITEAIWRHSGAGKHPRPKHVRASGTRYDVRKGLPIGDKGQYVLPGEEISCRCVSQSVVPGF